MTSKDRTKKLLKSSGLLRDFYTLNSKREPVPIDTIEELAKIERKGFRIARTRVWPKVEVSTVFLGIDHRFDRSEKTKPILWETMIFGGRFDGHQRRYTSHRDAKIGHRRVVLIALFGPIFSPFNKKSNLLSLRAPKPDRR